MKSGPISMKRVWFFTLIWLLLSLVGPARSQSTGSAIAWNMDQLLVEIYTQPQHSPQLESSLPFVAAQLSSAAGDEWIGLVFGNLDRDRFWVYELYDVGAEQVIKRISLNEMLGVTQDQGCKVILDDQIDREHVETEYEIRTGVYHFVLKRFITLLPDVNVAGSKRLLIRFDLANLGTGTTDVRFSIRHANDDFAQRYDDQTIFTINRGRNALGDEMADWPILVQTYEPTPEMLQLEGPQQGKDAHNITTVTWADKSVQRRIAKGRVELGRVHITLTTLDALFAREQAENLAAYLETSHPNPKLSVQIDPDKWEVYPGDTISYRLQCVHTGTGKSVGGAVVDPIPSGVKYLDGTAYGNGTVISYSMDGGTNYLASPPLDSEVTHIRWEIQDSLDPGTVLQMGFQVQVQ